MRFELSFINVLLNLIGYIELGYLQSFIISFVTLITFFSLLIKLLLAKINISLVSSLILFNMPNL